MLPYIIRRLLLVVPTLFAIMSINFAIVQFAPGGPVEQLLAEIEGTAVDATARISGQSSGEVSTGQQARPGSGEGLGGESIYRGAQGLDPEFIKEIEKQFGFDKPPLERFALMLGNYATFDFGKSYFRDETVVNLVLEVNVHLDLVLKGMEQVVVVVLDHTKMMVTEAETVVIALDIASHQEVVVE